MLVIWQALKALKIINLYNFPFLQKLIKKVTNLWIHCIFGSYHNLSAGKMCDVIGDDIIHKFDSLYMLSVTISNS